MTDTIPDRGAFAIETLGCKVNRVEADSLRALILQKGNRIVPLEEADCVIVNTCTVTGEADKKARKAVRNALKEAPQALIVVTGCAAAIAPEMFTSIDSRVVVVDRIQLVSELSEDLPTSASQILRLGDGFRTRVGIKVQDGCDRACTYCIVHVARGPAHSTPFERVLDEASSYIERGVKELVLTGIDLGSYNSDERTIEDLIEAIIELADNYNVLGDYATRVRASSLEPISITSRMIELLAESEGQLCRHLHLPLQSGSSKVLREMARPYDADRFMNLVDSLYHQVPELSLTTDIICGFPGETEQDFLQTLELARAARFSKIHVFPYSRREGTPAAAREDQVPPEIIQERAAELRLLAEQLRSEDLLRRSGSSELVLVEDTKGLTESYHEIALEGEFEQGMLTSMVLP